MDRRPPRSRAPRSRALWVAWAAALVGGLAVLVAVLLVARTGLDAGCARAATCREVPGVATTLALLGTAVAVVGGLAATVLGLRRR